MYKQRRLAVQTPGRLQSALAVAAARPRHSLAADHCACRPLRSKPSKLAYSTRQTAVMAEQSNNPGTAAFSTDSDERVKQVLASIRGIPDFPKKGIYFYDITTMLLDPTCFQHVIDLFVERYADQKVDVIAGFEARGFIIGPPVALRLRVPFVPLRKPGKLPGKTIKASYDLEYGSDAIEVHDDAIQPGQRVLLIDDLVATGGTLAAGVKLMGQLKAEVVEAAAVLELQELGGRAKLPHTPLHALAVVSEYGPGGLPDGGK